MLMAALVVFALFGMWLVPAFQAATGGMYPIDMVMPTTAAVIYANFAAYTDESIRIYHRFMVVDFFWPPLLAVVFAMIWTWLARRSAVSAAATRVFSWERGTGRCTPTGCKF